MTELREKVSAVCAQVNSILDEMSGAREGACCEAAVRNENMSGDSISPLPSISQAKAGVPWVSPVIGTVCEGRLLGRYRLELARSDMYYYQILLSGDCAIWAGAGLDAVHGTASKGQIVNLSEWSSVDFGDEVSKMITGAKFDVRVRFDRQEEHLNGRKSWVTYTSKMKMEGEVT